MKKKIISLFMVAAMTASLVGCGGGDTPTEAPADTTTDAAAEEDNADDAAVCFHH